MAGQGRHTAAAAAPSILLAAPPEIVDGIASFLPPFDRQAGLGELHCRMQGLPLMCWPWFVGGPLHVE